MPDLPNLSTKRNTCRAAKTFLQPRGILTLAEKHCQLEVKSSTMISHYEISSKRQTSSHVVFFFFVYGKKKLSRDLRRDRWPISLNISHYKTQRTVLIFQTASVQYVGHRDSAAERFSQSGSFQTLFPELSNFIGGVTPLFA